MRRMRRTAAVAALLAALLALAGAGCGQGQEAEGLRLWYPTDAASPGRGAQAVSWERFTGADSTVDTLTAALLAGPVGDGLVNPFPAGTRVLDGTLHGSILRLDLSEQFGSLTGVDLTLADCCLVLTLCQLEEVEQVFLLVEGIPVSDRALGPQDVIFTGAEEQPRQIAVALYFPRSLGKGLGFETRELVLTEDDDLYVTIAGELLKGPTDPDLQTFLPGPETLLGVWMDEGICTVNFSAGFVEQAPESETERNLLLYSVVDTLGNLDSVAAVQLLVEGERLPEFGGAETNLPLEPDFGLLSVG